MVSVVTRRVRRATNVTVPTQEAGSCGHAGRQPYGKARRISSMADTGWKKPVVVLSGMVNDQRVCSSAEWHKPTSHS